MAGYKINTQKSTAFLGTEEKINFFKMPFKLICIDRNRPVASWGWGWAKVRGKEWEGRGSKEHKETFGVIWPLFLIVVMAYWVILLPNRTHGSYSYQTPTKMCSLLYVNYTSIKFGEDVKKQEHLYTDVSIKWCNNLGKQFDTIL